MYNQLGNPGVAALAIVPGLRSVRYLDLYENEVGDEGAHALAGSPYLREVQILRLSREKMSRAGLTTLQKCFGDALEAR